MKYRKSRAALAVVLAAVTVLTAACSAQPGAAAPKTGSPTSSTQTASPDAVNALELTGPRGAPVIADMEPVVTDADPSLPATVTDVNGTEVTVSSADRVLALDLYGTLTDTVIGLGLHDRLVGRANSDLQALLSDLPVVTKNGHDLNVEAVLNLNPDLVLTNTTIGSDKNYAQLEDAGVTVVRFEQVPHIDAIAGAIADVGAALGVPDAAEQLAEHTTEELAAAQDEIDALRAETPRPPRAAVLYVRGTAGIFFILGEDYGAADILAALGLEDVALENGITDLKPANAEALVTLDPEIILAMKQGVESTGGIDGLLDRAGVSETTAGSHERIVTAPDSQLLSYGPRTPQSLIALARAIYTAAA
ncbi:ABC transporter substrate-binding protein [Microbacterium sp. MPKO10]|uniref:ABC transporter substrate-binding protein n=1 Tax=Microbacterium sp. MPKO10 TaxID=2989818 RepID=UPI0022354596|nr:ABC transporter substrate-binding protein [Microbacterium sp. MPKO10]MCW4458934.1 ABC transporter substrate-binding protein [Microbacterium sp. MPKO10]